MAGLHEQSRRPKSHPATTPYRIRQAIIELRNSQLIPLGAKKIQTKLQDCYPHETPPSITTIYHILNQAGLIQPRRHRHRVPPGPQPFAPVHDPNEVWSTDYKGQFKLRNSRWCYPLTVMDHQSRYLLCCQGLAGTRFIETKQVFTRLFKTYGLPQRIRSDNGVPFASRAAGGLSRLAIWWVRLGILPERIEPGQPQQNGRHERMHRTLKQAVTHPPSASFSAQQRRFNQFCTEYNEQRPHEALKQQTPASCYVSSTRPFPDKVPPLHYPDYFDIKTVQHSGVVNWRNRQVYISHLLYQEQIGLEQIADGIWHVYFGPIRLGGFDERDVKGNTVPYLTIKV